MCGRVITPSSEEIRKSYGLSGPEIDIVINVPPAGAKVHLPIFRFGNGFEQFSWPLIPKWAKTENIGLKTANARLEKVTDPETMWYKLKDTQPCAIFTKGFYEWQQVDPKNPKTKKIPHVIRTIEPLTVMAGFWDVWRNPVDGMLLHSCSMITMEGNELMKEIHNVEGEKNGRMPAFLTSETIGLWTDLDLPYSERSKSLIQYPSEFLVATPISDVTDRAEVLSVLNAF
ncbi:SOS response-associated peptidase family protein [Pedobacter xixiisoli]|uniref:Abasic site processing protein n=1 Tax=Pedobacter xixiisoli TaxID=1476464 RepID=A0A286A786_9SPHI|nr:SOS response-associated peptidase family protein [Pedobacter xixiisoli]SOD17783.1 Putative SOS response-associated peptidase YedK [Pedobacter xixiisoli]